VDDPTLSELVKIRELLEKLTTAVTTGQSRWRRGWLTVFEIISFIAAAVAIAAYFTDLLLRRLP